MEKVIEVLEESLKRVFANIEEQREEYAEERKLRDKLCAEIAEKERLVDEIAQALPHVTGAPELVLKDRLKRADQRIEDARKSVVRVNERIKDLEESNKRSLEKLKEYEYSIARLKGEVPKAFPPKVWKETACCGGWVEPIETAEDVINEVSKAFGAVNAISEETSKAVGNIVLGGSLPICEVKIDMDDTLKILKESFPTIEDFLKFAYGESAVKECSKNMQEAIAGGLTAGLIARRLKGVNLK